jgi:hypothetical protein
MTKWALLRAFDKFERVWTYDACFAVSVMPDPADGPARTA